MMNAPFPIPHPHNTTPIFVMVDNGQTLFTVVKHNVTGIFDIFVNEEVPWTAHATAFLVAMRATMEQQQKQATTEPSPPDTTGNGFKSPFGAN